ncbi:MAG TPA: hypothetical protein VIW73_08645 [Candidatus Cybelea sp.]
MTAEFLQMSRRDVSQTPIVGIADVEALRLADPKRYRELLDAYYSFLGSHVASPGHAIECAEAGELPCRALLNDSKFEPLFHAALAEVRAERRQRDRVRDTYDRRAAALLAASRLRFKDEAS